jgi:hypothetical protein
MCVTPIKTKPRAIRLQPVLPPKRTGVQPRTSLCQIYAARRFTGVVRLSVLRTV